MATTAPKQNPPDPNGRGIRNAQVSTSDERFNERAEGRLSRARFLKGDESSRGKFAANDPVYNKEDGRASRKKLGLRQARHAYKSVQRIFKESGETISDDDIDEIHIKKPENPGFPFVILTIAVIKDLADIPANLLVIGIPISMMTSFLMSLILFFWVLGKMRFGRFKKKIIRWLLTRGPCVVVLEMIPFVQIIPVTTIFILMVYNKEKKLVKLFDRALDELRRSKFMP